MRRRARIRCPGRTTLEVLDFPGREGQVWPYASAVISAMHALVYADDAESARRFFRDVLGWPHVDAGGGWLIFKAGPSELGVHPAAGAHDGEDGSAARHHEVSLMCDDIEQTVVELRERGVKFTRDIRDDGFGLTTALEVPGAGEMMLYQPRHPPAYNL
jgi:predicted enzyme related to lactoylglutathione lyase